MPQPNPVRLTLSRHLTTSDQLKRRAIQDGRDSRRRTGPLAGSVRHRWQLARDIVAFRGTVRQPGSLSGKRLI
jgi:hypothetical protein